MRLQNWVLCSSLILFTPTALLAAEVSTPCGRHSVNSEFSWNPAARFETPRLLRFYDLGREIGAAYTMGNDAEVRSLAAEYLQLASVYRCNWNYGNAVYDSNRYLGLVSLRNGKSNEAAKFLELSAKTPGSPQLDTFGPDLDLANELLRRGEVASVTRYLQSVKAFWKQDNGQVDRWLVAIQDGKKPALERFYAITQSPWMIGAAIAATAIGIAYPALIVLSFLCVARRRLTRKLTFVIAGSLIAYATFYLADWGLRAARINVAISHFRIRNLIVQLLVISLPALLEMAIPVVVVSLLLRFWRQRYGISANPS